VTDLSWLGELELHLLELDGLAFGFKDANFVFLGELWGHLSGEWVRWGGVECFVSLIDKVEAQVTVGLSWRLLLGRTGERIQRHERGADFIRSRLNASSATSEVKAKWAFVRSRSSRDVMHLGLAALHASFGMFLSFQFCKVSASLFEVSWTDTE
jgi:hypothetical protein